ncbi:MAG TPA: hypothetical protein VFA45_02035 [Actinomycetes bacterium]|nr:hypothetical protein [Actinomycetes bacterium]
MSERPASDPRRRLQQAVRRLRANITEVRHAADALSQDAGYETAGVPVPAGIWQAVELLEQWARGLQASAPRRPWRDPPDSG